VDLFACLVSSSPPTVLLDLARAFSPRVEQRGNTVLFDVSGLGRIVGDTPAVGRELAREARARAVDASIAIAATGTAARLLSAGCLMSGAWCEGVPGAWRVPGAWGKPDAWPVIVVPRGEERAAVGTLPVNVLTVFGFSDHLPTFRRWGLRTLGEVAALAPEDLHARLGAAGLALHRIVCGRDDGPLVPYVDAAQFEASMDLEWPIDALEPLSFVLARLLEPLSAALERADRGASAIALTLTLVTREAVTRRLELPAPMRDARTFRTLLLLHLESQPVADAIDRVAVRLEPTPARIVQYSLLERALPSPETLSTLVARLEALMGAGRVGAPALVDSHEPGAFELRPFACAADPAFRLRSELRTAIASAEAVRPGVVGSSVRSDDSSMPDLKVGPTYVLRRFRLPVPARVAIERGRPVRVTTSRRSLGGGRVIECAGPWRASGRWWGAERQRGMAGAGGGAPAQAARWNKDEWDVALPDGVYRIYRDRDSNQWFLEGILD
jgi:protein ImuB